MRNLIAILVMSFMFVGLNAQGVSANMAKEVKLERVDKNSEMAFIYQNGVLQEKGLLVKGKREGVWQSFNTNGTLCTEASFSNGMKNGVWNVYEDAELKYVLHYQQDVRMQASNLAIAQ